MKIINVPEIITTIKARSKAVGLFDADDVLSAYSGGKDSTCVYLIMNDLLGGNFIPYMADTDNEHELTIEYARTIHEKVDGGPKVQIVKAIYTEEQFATRRKNLAKAWRLPHKIQAGKQRGVMMPMFSDEIIEQALAVLHPTGNSFLDSILLHGMFPIRRTRFCTFDLKIDPAYEQIIKPIISQCDGDVFQLTGVRSDESKERALQVDYELDERDESGFLHIFKPIFDLTATEVFAVHKYYGIEPNPLYKLGFERVGCMPCILSTKDEIRNISNRFPEHIDRIREWERVLNLVSRWSNYTQSEIGFLNNRGKMKSGGIDEVVLWSRTERNGTVSILADDTPSCSSKYGLCE